MIEPPSRDIVTRKAPRTTRVSNRRGRLPHPVESESTLEEDFVDRATLLPNVFDIVHQPFTVVVPDGRKYTPDFLLVSFDRSRYVVEVKRQKRLADYVELFDQVALELLLYGFKFVALTEHHIHADRAHIRARRILRYLKAGFSPDLCSRALAFVPSEEHGISIGELIGIANIDRPLIYHLLCIRQLQTEPRLMLDDRAVLRKANLETFNGDDFLFSGWDDAALWLANTGNRPTDQRNGVPS